MKKCIELVISKNY